MANLVDLDELALRCRDVQARLYIQEAVSCYKAGAYRSCIVSTWNAVVFDYLHKLGELELSGDVNAKRKLEEFELIRAGGEARLKQALEFERKVIDIAASEFELLTPLEKIDLKRLHDDRNRCAHPSMQSPDDPYQPTAELARTHLRNTVEILLQREPVQGKAALDRIMSEVQSKYFPERSEDAIRHFQAGPLRRARKALVRNLLIVLGKKFLRETVGSEERRRILAATNAIIEMHRAVAEEVFRTDITSIMRETADDNLYILVGFCRRIRIAWESLDAPTVIRLERYVDTVEGNGKTGCIAHAMGVPELKARAAARLPSFDEDDFVKLMAIEPILEYAPFVIPMFSRAGGYRHAERLGENLIVPLAHLLSAEQLVEIHRAVMANGQIWDAGGIQSMLGELFEGSNHLRIETKTSWQELLTFLKDCRDHDGWYGELQTKMEDAGMWPVE